MSCHPSIVLHMALAYEGSASVVLFLDMRNENRLISDSLYCAGFTAGFRNQDDQNERPQFVSDFSL